MKLTSSAFAQAQGIPVKFTGEGEGFSPPLLWRDAPVGTRSFALIAEDPDAPGGTWVHWLVYDIPASSHGMPDHIPASDVLDDGSKQGRNSFGELGYGGPYPPAGHGPHRYYFRLFALDKVLALKPGVQKAGLEGAMRKHVLAEAELMGRFERKSPGMRGRL